MGYGFIILVAPVEGLLEGLFAVIGVVFGIDAVTDDEYLDILEQTAAGPIGVVLVAVDLFKGFFQFQAAAFEFYLHQGQTVDQQGDVVAVFIAAFHGNLPGDLEMVLAPVFLLDELDINALAVVFGELHFIPQDPGPVEYGAFVQVVENPGKFFIGEGGIVVGFQLGFQVGQQVFPVFDFDVGIAQFGQLLDQVIF